MAVAIPVSHPEIVVFHSREDRLDDVESLWKSLHHHHAAIASHLGETRTPEESWRRRRGRYAQWLEEPESFFLIAEMEDTPVGYAFVHLVPGSEIWATGDRIARIETMCVLPGVRSNAIGTALIEAGRQILQPIGVREASFSAMTKNEQAIAFFERFGSLPTMVSFRAPV